jgi:hypothetical protein
MFESFFDILTAILTIKNLDKIEIEQINYFLN